MAVDNTGTVYVADTGNHTIRKITPRGVVTTIGGTPGEMGGADGIGGSARFSRPKGLAADTAGNIYVADTHNGRITKGTPLPVPYSPCPTDTQTDLPLSSVLSWTGTAPSLTFDLYLDTINPPTTKIATGLADTTFTPTLTLGTRYYWQIVAIHPLGQISGPVWTFATHLPADIGGDAAVTLSDLKLLVAAWNSTPSTGPWNPAADIDNDGAVSLADLKVLVSNWNRSV